jgi:hypothetical protein
MLSEGFTGQELIPMMVQNPWEEAFGVSVRKIA